MADHEWGGRDKLDFALRNGECWVIEKGGKEFVEWMATPEDDREDGLQRFGIKGQKVGPEALREKIGNPVDAIIKLICVSQKTFDCLKMLNESGTLSSEGTTAMQTLGDNIKARLHHAHRYSMCYNTHTDVT